ncbi:TVP38/TMEM64 family protein [Desulfuromusa kysingii]|uniref:TVP38/TMEM64 family protein n=1 Tax=Desulfuromusa kysingii TaxID=37625 RepID=UPI001587CE43|nr:TVP38/TMEM64 family protein [Desulfuromusa kysingii]
MSPIKLIFGTLWLSLFIVALFFWWRSTITLVEVPLLLQHLLNDVGLYKAASIYILIYAVRPLILFPATLLTVASGLIFGPWLGTLFTIVGENASANLGFSLSHWFGRKTVETYSTGWLNHWDTKLRQNGIVTVMTMRLIMLPFDAVNFGCGLTAIRHRDYAIGTFIGILPSLVGFVLLGGIAASGVQHRFLVLTLSIFFMVLGFTLAHHLKRREGANFQQN